MRFRRVSGTITAFRRSEFLHSEILSRMFVIEIFLPLRDNRGDAFSKSAFDAVKRTLTDRFGGVTQFVRAPAIGLWEDDRGEVRRDEIVVYEVMAESLDRAWWRSYRARLEADFKQEEVVIRATDAQRL
jgi:hypothetical protein